MSDLGIYQQNEIPPDLTYQFLDSSGAVIDITGWSASSVVTAPDGTQTTPTASVTDGPNGIVARPWTAAMTAQTGRYRSAITVTNGTYTTISRRLAWIVEPTP